MNQDEINTNAAAGAASSAAATVVTTAKAVVKTRAAAEAAAKAADAAVQQQAKPANVLRNSKPKFDAKAEWISCLLVCSSCKCPPN